MSFIDQILEEREFKNDIEALEEEFKGMEQEFNELKERAEKLNEDAMDFGDKTDIGEIFDEAQKRMKTAKWAFGLTNKLKSPEDRKKHRRNIITVMNKLRALINRLIKQLTVEVRDDSGGRVRQNRGEGQYGPQNPARMGRRRPAMAT